MGSKRDGAPTPSKFRAWMQRYEDIAETRHRRLTAAENTEFEALQVMIEKWQFRSSEWAAEAAAPQAPAAIRDAAILGEINAERLRQRDELGHDSAHDDTHHRGEIAAAAAVYANPLYVVGWPWRDSPKPDPYLSTQSPTRRRQLIKSAALVVAEIARLDRAAEAS